MSSDNGDSLEQGKRVTKEALLFLEEVEKHFRGKDKEFIDFKVTMFDYLRKRIDDERFASKINKLFEGNEDLILRFDSLMPDDYLILESIQMDSVCYDEAKEFARNIMASFEGHQKTFKDLNSIFRNSNTPRDVHQMVSVVFKDKPELLEQFVRFLPGRYVLTNSNHLESDRKRKSTDLHQEEENGERDGRSSSRMKLISKPVQELDLSKCESCTPSYRLLPKNHQIPGTSHRTQLGREVLNDRCVLAPSESENGSFKLGRKNEYEKALFRCQDDMYELDMLMSWVSSTAERIEEIMKRTDYSQAKETDDGSFCIEDHLKGSNLRTIERLYADQGLEVIDVLKKKPFRALPRILIRLKKKHEQLTMFRHECSEIWSQAIAENHRKLLDHQSSASSSSRDLASTSSSEHSETGSQANTSFTTNKV